MIFSRNSKLSIKDSIPLNASDVEFLYSAKQFKVELLQLIKSARQRIYITALYLQDDDAGREILHAIFAAKQENPELDVCLFVDFHRAQRGLIGEKKSLGNRQLYLDLSAQYEHDINIYGVAVKQREFLGVLHLKGFVIDDTLLFSGASINNIYLHEKDRYRCDRYHKFSNVSLANSFVNYLTTYFINSQCTPKINQSIVPDKRQMKGLIKQLKRVLNRSKYTVTSDTSMQNDLIITPLVGLGGRGNQLNLTARSVFKVATNKLVVFTPYFNLPKALAGDLSKALKKGVQVTIVVGDKKANDFYIAEPEKFSTIGIVPYIYEMLLRVFIKRNQAYIDKGQLNVHLWQDGSNSYHLKGIVADDTYHLITGSNLNPRAWSLDLENGLLLCDKQQQLKDSWHKELAMILANTNRVTSVDDIEAVRDYPDKPRELLRKIKITQFGRILKRFL
ncbi:CDP-diacylglycerol--serine O-phosphatidyltransferase [Thalassotalea sp. ND16A]|uniref:CDP-diacylglycerol--serine O-phosphatidyltransferase n=1 Tax=Thalassotalea sp. ND16A TaxID=1535422 RepID=UPI00051A335C|nr:CDP-diacylglycerol--serine O-phosphatidyltransferase [Thalassotalea sp. ND16A]KGJ99197.1 CDP-diacylglycerol--serine O-phosphatidyltransferase [Thalassotalea sp. ND16A]